MTKAHKKRMHSAAWSPAARAKRKATMEAKREARLVVNGMLGPATRKSVKIKRNKRGEDVNPMRDVIVFLEHAERAILKSGAKRITAGESYAMLALTQLRGG